MYPKEMVMEFLRKNLTDLRSDREYTGQQDSFTGHTDEIEFTLTEVPISHIDSVTVAGSPLRKWMDYDIDLGLSKLDQVGKITLHTATSSDVVVNYKTASDENQWIFTDHPEVKIKYPVISVFNISESKSRRGFGSGEIKTIDSIMLQISVWTKYKQIIISGGYRYSHNSLANKLASDVESAVLAYINTELNPQLIFPEGGITIHSVIPDPDRMNIWHKPIDLNLFSAT